MSAEDRTSRKEEITNSDDYLREMRCNGCNEYFPIDDLEVCPSGEEIKHGVFVPYRFCRECCQDNFDSGGCREDIGACDIATEMMSHHLKEYVLIKMFDIDPKIPHVYLDEFHIYCLGEHSHPPNEVFKDVVVSFDDNITFFEGREYSLVTGLEKQVSFSNRYLNEISEIFEDLGCFQTGFSILKNRAILIVWGTGIWAALAPRVNGSAYEIERWKFIDNVKKGYDFFELTDDDGLVLVEIEKMEFDWSKLNDKDFTLLCYDIIKSLPKIKEVRITEGSGDLGQDIRAVEMIEDLIGQSTRDWTIQCKHYPSRKVHSNDIANILNAYQQLKFDVFCLMSSNFLAPGCERMIRSWDRMPHLRFRTAYWDRKQIEDYLRNKLEIYARYFLKKK